jgi:multiple sugar transport system substrate-binding protein
VPVESNTRSRSWPRSAALVSAVAVSSAFLAACGGGDETGATQLNLYINPDSSGSTHEVARVCSEESNGAWNLNVNVLPATADGQREQLVRRLAAGDESVDIMLVDPPYMPELANAGWLMSLEDHRDEILKDILESPIESAEWKGELFGAPYSANTQLMWYRKSVVQQAGLDMTKPVTWDQVIDAAIKTGTTIGEQGRRYEGYMVWVNGLITSAGGAMLENNDRGRDADVTVDSEEGRKAAEIINKMANSEAAPPGLSTMDEEISRAAFQAEDGGFLMNWPYIWASMLGNVEDGSLDQAVVDDVGWARYPRVDANTPSAPPLGGVNIGIGAFTQHPEESLDAVMCMIQPDKLKIRFLGIGDPVANGTVYDDPEVREKYPMADLMRESINDAGPRPVTPYYGDVSGAIQRTWHPPSGVNPDSTPQESTQLIVDVLHDKRLL